MHTIEELKALIAAKLELDTVLDILGWSFEEFLDVIEDHIEDNRTEFEDAVE
jgi:hypothetical protein